MLGAVRSRGFFWLSFGRSAAVFEFDSASARARIVSFHAQAATGKGAGQGRRVLVEQSTEHFVESGALVAEHLGRPKKVFGKDSEEFVLACVRIVTDSGPAVGGVSQFSGDIPDPLMHDLARDFRGQAALRFLLFDEMGELVDSDVGLIRGVGKCRQK